MPHLPATAARPIEMHGVTFSPFARTDSGSTTLATWRADFAPHTPGQTHSMTAEEVLTVLTGSLDVELGDERFTATAGDAVLVPAGAAFRVSNATDEPATAWAVTTLGMRARMATGEEIVPPWAQ